MSRKSLATLTRWVKVAFLCTEKFQIIFESPHDDAVQWELREAVQPPR